MRIESVEIKLRLAVYITPDGKRICGELPAEYNLGHFSAELRAFCITQYFQCHVTAPLLLQQLYEMGIDISAAELSNILIQGQESFHKEKEEIREAGLKYSDYVNADDTSARHNGKNGYCIAISSSLFSYFKSGDSKSRINFLKVLQGDGELYAINEEGLNYAFENEISDIALDKLEESEGKKFRSLAAWQKFLKKQSIQSENDIRIATEAALVGGVLHIGIDLIKLPIISDAAPQFSLLVNTLCWVHEERHYRKLIPISDNERKEIDKVRSEIWNFYAALKSFKLRPTINAQMQLSERFDQIFSAEYPSDALKTLMANTKFRKEGLLMVLKHSIVPLHNNDCERDIREYAKRRKISLSSFLKSLVLARSF